MAGTITQKTKEKAKKIKGSRGKKLFHPQPM
jgi:hypothetical protein